VTVKNTEDYNVYMKRHEDEENGDLKLLKQLYDTTLGDTYYKKKELFLNILNQEEENSQATQSKNHNSDRIFSNEDIVDLSPQASKTAEQLVPPA